MRVFIVGYEMECEKTLFSKTKCTGESLATGMNREFKSLVTRLGQLYFLSCSDPVSLTLHLPTCFTCMLHFSESTLASHLFVAYS